MNVHYTPSLREQIAGRKLPKHSYGSGRICYIRSAGNIVKRIDPATRQCTDEWQQFRLDGMTLSSLQKSEWVSDPEIIDVDGTIYR